MLLHYQVRAIRFYAKVMLVAGGCLIVLDLPGMREGSQQSSFNWIAVAGGAIIIVVAFFIDRKVYSLELELEARRRLIEQLDENEPSQEQRGFEVIMKEPGDAGR